MAKKFNFKLETVLNYRTILEDKRKREFSQALSACEHEKQALKHIENEIRNALSSFTQLNSKSNFTARDFFAYQHFISGLQYQKEQQIEQVHRAQNELEKKRKIYIQATQDTKVIQRLKEQEREKYLYEMSQLEQKFLDELSIIRERRKQIISN